MSARAMKPSGVDWIGEIPASWSIKRTRHVCSMTTGGRDTQDAVDDGPYPFFVRSDTVERIDTYSFDGEGVLTSGDGAGVGKIFHYYVGKFEFHQRVYLYFNFRGILGKFFFYYIRENLATVVLAGNAKSTVDSLRRPQLVDFPVVLPPLDEQRHIVAFLDAKTAAIDALIAKKERLLALLAEKRQATLTHAVTRGLDPNAPMKDSGVAWIGEVPAHWTVKRLGFLLRGIEQGWSPECENRQADDDEWGVLKVGCVNYGRFRDTENKALPANLAPIIEYQVRVGDVLMSRANTRDLVGSAAFVETTRNRLLICDKLYRLNCIIDLDRKFLSTILQSHVCRYQLESDATGASGSMQNIGQDSVRGLIFAWPPLEEQHHIVAHLQTELERLDALTQRARAMIDKLREYRQALITAAVTGAIDLSAHGDAANDARALDQAAAG